MTTTLLEPNIANAGAPAVDADMEPSDEWKVSTRARVEQEFRPDVERYRQECDEQLLAVSPDSPEYHAALRAYNNNMHLMRMRAQDRFNQELKLERYSRAIALGREHELEGGEFEALRRQQQAIYDQIQRLKGSEGQSSSQSQPSSQHEQQLRHGEPKVSATMEVQC